MSGQATKTAGLLVGIGFGFWLGWTGFTDYDVILSGLTFRNFYLWKVFVGGVVLSSLALLALKRSGASTLIDRAPIEWSRSRPTRDTFVGAVIFGVGWAIAGACPGPVIAQLGRGQLAALFTAAGIWVGVLVRGWLVSRHLRDETGPDTIPAGLSAATRTTTRA